MDQGWLADTRVPAQGGTEEAAQPSASLYGAQEVRMALDAVAPRE